MALAGRVVQVARLGYASVMWHIVPAPLGEEVRVAVRNRAGNKTPADAVNGRGEEFESPVCDSSGTKPRTLVHARQRHGEFFKPAIRVVGPADGLGLLGRGCDDAEAEPDAEPEAGAVSQPR